MTTAYAWMSRCARWGHWLWLLPATAAAQSLTFEQVVIDPAGIAYQRAIGDLDGDGRPDIVAFDEAAAGQLYWFRGPGFVRATLFTLKQSQHGWPNFRGDDLELVDLDRDGDLDIVARIGDSGDVNGRMAWIEQVRSTPGTLGTLVLHGIGDNAYVKDIAIADVDRDGRLDVVSREQEHTQVWFQDGPDSWTEKVIAHPAREGMDVGDLDGDGDPDIVLNGFWLETPAAPRTGTYTRRTIDSQWFNEGIGGLGDSCKVAVADINGDGRLEVVLSDSENTREPVAWYSASNPLSGPWTLHVITSRCDYCHSLHVGDFNRDGKPDVLAGGMPASPQSGLTVYLGNGGSGWTPYVIQDLGAYSARVGDVDGDGDLDVVNIRNYDQAPTEIWRNLLPAIARSPDFDGDTDVDQADFGHMQACLTGPDLPQTSPSCLNARLDADLDVDTDDLARFYACFSGADVPADAACLP